MIAKGFQNDAKMEAKIYDGSCFSEKGECWKTIGFSNRKHWSGNTKRFQNLSKFDAKSMPKEYMEKRYRKDTKMMLKWHPKSHDKLEIE